jgi:cell division septation protein DedD
VSEKPAAPAPTNNASAPQWKHALQAMASQNQAEALQLAERLKGAGVPAYMVVADLGSRGRWFRVRIGGFATPADAQRFVAEVRTRARVAGVPLKDLNVCDYEKP